MTQYAYHQLYSEEEQNSDDDFEEIEDIDSESEDSEDATEKFIPKDVEKGKSKYEDPYETKRQNKFKWYLAVTLATLSGCFFTANNAILKRYELSQVDTIMFRSIIQLFVLGIWIMCNAQSLRYNFKIQVKLYLGGFSSAAILLCSYRSLHYMPLGDAMTLLFSSPLFTVILERIAKGTKITGWKICCVLALIFGVILVAKPPLIFGQEISPGEEYFKGVAIALTASFMGAANYVLIGEVKNEVPTSVISFYAGLNQILVALAFIGIDEKAGQILHPTWEIMASTIIITIMGIAAYCMMAYSCVILGPTIVSFVRALEIIFAVACQIYLLGNPATPLTILGSALVILSVIANVVESKVLDYLPGFFGNGC